MGMASMQRGAWQRGHGESCVGSCEGKDVPAKPKDVQPPWVPVAARTLLGGKKPWLQGKAREPLPFLPSTT